MSDRISDEQLQLYLDQLESLRKRNPGEWMHEAPWRMALEEIRERRARDLTGELNCAPSGRTAAMARLSDDELDEALAVAQSLNSLRLTAAVAELRERRARDLTGEDIASLDWCLGFIKMMRGGGDHEPFNVHAERALSTLFKLLTRGNR